MGFDKALIFGKQVDVIYSTIIESYRMLKIMSYAFDYDGDKEFNEAFIKYFSIKDKKENPIDMEKFTANEDRIAKEMLIPFLKMYPRRSQLGLKVIKSIYKKYWEKMIIEEFELLPEMFKNIKSYDEIKDILVHITKKLNEKDRTFSLRSYNHLFPKQVVKRLCGVNKEGSEIIKELANEGRLYISDDNYVYLSMIEEKN